MAFDTYTEISVAADEVEDLIAQQRINLDSHKAGISAVVSAMTTIGTKYGPIVAAVASKVTADPTNPAKLFLQAHINQLLTDFNTIQTEASTLDGLVNT